MNRTNLLQLLEDFKANKLYKPPTTGGGPTGADPEIEIKQAEQTRDIILIENLEKVIKNNANWLKYIYAILTAIIVLLSIFLWKKQNDMTFFFAILGGQGVSILFCINRLSYFYKQKRGSEILLHLYTSSRDQKEKNKILDEIILFLKDKK